MVFDLKVTRALCKNSPEILFQVLSFVELQEKSAFVSPLNPSDFASNLRTYHTTCLKGWKRYCKKLFSKSNKAAGKSSIIVIRAHVVKVYNNYASTRIIYKVNRYFSFLPIIFFDKENATNAVKRIHLFCWRIPKVLINYV